MMRRVRGWLSGPRPSKEKGSRPARCAPFAFDLSGPCAGVVKLVNTATLEVAGVNHLAGSSPVPGTLYPLSD